MAKVSKETQEGGKRWAVDLEDLAAVQDNEWSQLIKAIRKMVVAADSLDTMAVRIGEGGGGGIGGQRS